MKPALDQAHAALLLQRPALVGSLAVLLACAACNQAEALKGGAAGTGHNVGLSFSDVTSEAGIGDFRHETGAFGAMWVPESFGAGGGFLDYDGDGWLDVVLVGGGYFPEHGSGTVPALRFYRNDGDGTFTETTEQVGLGEVTAYGFGIAAADYDNDGDEDIFLTTLHEDLLFRNEGGRFVEVGKQAGIANRKEFGTAAIFFDADRDGWLDLYVGNYIEWTPENDIWCTVDGKTKSYCTPQDYQGTPGRYYHNDGDGTFSDWTERAGFLPAPGKTLGVAELDYNKDGWPDLIVANDTQRNLLYENDGDGSFTEKGIVSGVAFNEHGKARAGMGVDAGDVDNSGQYTVAIGNFSHEMVGFYRYAGHGMFVDRAPAAKIGQASLLSLTFGLFLFDADLDGYLDAFLANGHLTEDIDGLQDGVTYRQAAQLFINQQDGTYEDMRSEIGEALGQKLVGRGAAYGDYDRDGDLDILVTENGGPVHLWRNDLGNQARYVRVLLEGTESNRDGLGARIVVNAGESRMDRRVRTGSSYLSQSEKAVTFGLGSADRVDSLIVNWPSGQTDRLAEIAAGQEIRIVEGQGGFTRLEPGGTVAVVQH